MYEYLSLQKPILCFPSDYDIVEKTILNSGAGSVQDSEYALYEKLFECISTKLNKQSISNQIPQEKLLEYSVSNQVEKLSSLLNMIS